MASTEYNCHYLESLTGLKSSELEDLLSRLGFPVEFAEAEGEKKIIVEVTPNRPDMLSGVGIKRFLSYYLSPEKTANSKLLYSFAPHDLLVLSDKKKDLVVNVDHSVCDVRPFIACMVVDGIKLTQDIFTDIIQFQEKLHATYGRKRKKIAIGFHDLAKVKFPVAYRAYSLTEKSFVPLGTGSSMTLAEILKSHQKGLEYSHLVNRKGVILEDVEGVLAFPPIINAAKTEVTESTKGFFVDVTGTNLFAVEKTLDIIACNLVDMGGKVFATKVIYPNDYNIPGDNEKISGTKVYPAFSRQRFKLLSNDSVAKITGVQLAKKDLLKFLLMMGYFVDEKSKSIIVPPYRIDVFGDADIIEDIMIAYGFEKIKPDLPNLFTIGNMWQSYDHVHHTMLCLGFSEVLTWVLGNKNKYQDFYDGSYAQMVNALTSEFNLVRPLLAPNILEVFATNKTFELPQKIYEIGQVAYKQGNSLVTREKLCVGIMANSISVNDAMSVLNGLFYELELEYEVSQKPVKGFIQNRCAEIICNGKPIGFVGEVHPEVLEKFGIPFPVVLFELDLIDMKK